MTRRPRISDRERAVYRKLDDESKGRVPYYDKRGRPIGLGQWAYLRTNHRFVQIRRTRINTPAGNLLVSTIWVGVDMGFGLTRRPVIFETMVFGLPERLPTWRYITLDAAQRGHRDVVKHIAPNLNPPANVAGRLIPHSKLRRPHR